MQNSTIAKPTILVEKKSHYGNTLYYPAGDDLQKSALRVLTKGQKTLSFAQCLALKNLGFHIEIKNDNPFTQ